MVLVRDLVSVNMQQVPVVLLQDQVSVNPQQVPVVLARDRGPYFNGLKHK